MSEKKYKVYTPNPHFTGRRFNVPFKDGVAECSKKEAEILVKNWGYKCPDLFPEEQEKAAPKEEKPDSSDAKVKNPDSTDAKTATKSNTKK